MPAKDRAVQAFHVASVINRASILAHGLDVRLMSGAPGIAGSQRAEKDGVFVCLSRFDVDFFVRMNNTGGPVDVWAIDGVDEGRLVESQSGFHYLPGRIDARAITLIERDLDPPDDKRSDVSGDTGAYQSSLTVTLADGTVLRGNAARRSVAPFDGKLRRYPGASQAIGSAGEDQPTGR